MCNHDNGSNEAVKNVGGYSLDSNGDVKMKNVLLLLSRLQNGDETVDLDDIKRAMGLNVKSKMEMGSFINIKDQSASRYAHGVTSENNRGKPLNYKNIELTEVKSSILKAEQDHLKELSSDTFKIHETSYYGMDCLVVDRNGAGCDIHGKYPCTTFTTQQVSKHLPSNRKFVANRPHTTHNILLALSKILGPTGFANDLVIGMRLLKNEIKPHNVIFCPISNNFKIDTLMTLAESLKISKKGRYTGQFHGVIPAAAYIAEICAACGIELDKESVQLTIKNVKPGKNIEETARDIRVMLLITRLVGQEDLLRQRDAQMFYHYNKLGDFDKSGMLNNCVISSWKELSWEKLVEIIDEFY